MRQSFIWTPDADQAFKQLKEALIKAPVLGYPLPKGQFILDTDASNHGVGAVLSQLQDGQERVVAYYSRVLTQPERQYCVTRRELLAVVSAVKHFHPYLYGHHFTVRNDHAALCWLLSFRHGRGVVYSVDKTLTSPCKSGLAHETIKASLCKNESDLCTQAELQAVASLSKILCMYLTIKL